MLTVLHGHTSPETAFVVEDYPYSFTMRCKIRYWIETAVKGLAKGEMRFMSQTSNPKSWADWDDIVNRVRTVYRGAGNVAPDVLFASLPDPDIGRPAVTRGTFDAAYYMILAEDYKIYRNINTDQP